MFKINETVRNIIINLSVFAIFGLAMYQVGHYFGSEYMFQRCIVNGFKP
jgi:hypothetical protein